MDTEMITDDPVWRVVPVKDVGHDGAETTGLEGHSTNEPTV